MTKTASAIGTLNYNSSVIKCIIFVISVLSLIITVNCGNSAYSNVNYAEIENSVEFQTFYQLLIKSKTSGLSLDESSQFRSDMKKWIKILGGERMMELTGSGNSGKKQNTDKKEKKKKEEYKDFVDEMHMKIGEYIIKVSITDMKLRQLDEGILEEMGNLQKANELFIRINQLLSRKGIDQEFHSTLRKMILLVRKNISSLEKLLSKYQHEMEIATEGSSKPSFVEQIRKGHNEVSMKYHIYVENGKFDSYPDPKEKQNVRKRLENLDQALGIAEKKEKHLLNVLDVLLTEQRNLVKLRKYVRDSIQDETELDEDTDDKAEDDEEDDDAQDQLTKEQWKGRLDGIFNKYQNELIKLQNSTFRAASNNKIQDEL